MADNVTAQAATTEIGETSPPTSLLEEEGRRGEHSSGGVTGSPADSAASPTPAEVSAESVETLPEWARKLVTDLRKENAGHRRAKTEAEKAAEAAARQAAEAQGKYKELYEAELQKAQAAEARAKAAELAGLRSKVGAKYQLPEALAGRLQGESEEALEADAKTLAAALPKAPAETDAEAGLNPHSPQAGLNDEQLRELAAVYGVSFEYLKSAASR